MMMSGAVGTRKNNSRDQRGPRKPFIRNDKFADEVVANKLFVGNLSRRCTEFMLTKVLKRFGNIKHFSFMWNNDGSGEPRGYAFVEYRTRAESEKAKRGLSGKKLLGRDLVVRFVRAKVGHNEPHHMLTSTNMQVLEEEMVKSSASGARTGDRIAAIQAKLQAMESEEKDKARQHKKRKSEKRSESESGGAVGDGGNRSSKKIKK